MALNLRAITSQTAFATLVGASVLGSSSAIAQQALTKGQCQRVTAEIEALATKYDGKMSGKFMENVKAFVAGDCDVNVKFKVMPGTSDMDAFRELRVKVLEIMRTSSWSEGMFGQYALFPPVLVN
jgi:hypothetical protein